MHSYALSHVRDDVLLRDLAALVTQDRATTATLLAHLGEADARRLYAPAGYPSMHEYCVQELRLSEDAAAKRIQAARAARRFPPLLVALAEGRLHLTAIRLLAPHLTESNASELIEMATHRRKAEIEEYLAVRFGLRIGLTSLRAVGASDQHDQHAPGHVECHTCANHAQAEPVFLLQVTLSKATQEKLGHAQELLSHAVPNGDVAEVLDRALETLISKIEKRKAGAGARRAQTRAECGRTRHIPAEVRRAVWERDAYQCTFVSESGVRCGARSFLEFDHTDPVARGGIATVESIRLRCRAHNQLEAERVFGAGFMARKREEARLAAAESRAKRAQVAEREDLIAGLKKLGLRAEEARRAADRSQSMECATFEERMCAALRSLGKPARSLRSG